jgi:hypothetical protein
MAIAGFEHLAKTRTSGAVTQRTAARMREAAEIARGFSALLLIIIGTMAVCLLLSLPQGLTH